MKLRPRTLLPLLAAIAITLPARAHVGNKDVFETITAGPYKFFVTIRPPLVIPGVATLEVRSIGAPVTSLTITPLMLTGEASKHPPTADAMTPSAIDPAFYTGSLWLMGSGSWQVRFAIDGSAGPMAASVPVAAAPIAVLHMQRPLGILLAILGLVLILGIVGIVIAAIRESGLPPGLKPDARRTRISLFAGGMALAVTLFAVYWGGRWWNVEAAAYASDIGQWGAADMHTAITGDTLDIRLGDPMPAADGKPATWTPKKLDTFIPDHGHLMHLYAIRYPQMDAVFHLHPVPTTNKSLDINLPAMPPGTYKLFADVVYISGFPETETATLTIPAGLPSVPLGAEDATAAPPPLSRGELGPNWKLPDGYTMVFDRPATITATTGYSFRFHLLDPNGNPATDMQPYLGMAGHAAFVKSDFTTFAHTHPEGSAAMPAMMLAEASTASINPHASTSAPMAMPAEPISNTVEFPYGFPTPGRYRIFIQMKHGNTVETGVFDVEVH